MAGADGVLLMTRRQDRAERLGVVAAKRMPESLEKYAPMLAPLEPANDDDPQGDEAWMDAIAGQDDTPASVDAAGTYRD